MKNGIVLRDYQKEAVTTMIQHFKNSKNDELIVLPTGTGKTEVFEEIIKRGLKEGIIKKAMILVHRDELIQQTYRRASKKLDCEIGIVKAGKNEIGCPLTIASVQTLARRKRLEQIPKQDMLVIDEAHHAIADSYQRVIDYLKHLNPNLFHFGATATPYRGDGYSLRSVYTGGIGYVKTLEWMIRNEYCALLRAIRVTTGISLEDVHIRMGDFKTDELAKVVNVENRNKLIVDTYIKRCEGRKALVYCVDRYHAATLANEFKKRDISVEMVLGNTPIKERREIYEKFKTGEIKVICNVYVLSEGFDEPTVDAILLARPTYSKTLYLQMIGRGSRVADGKSDCLIVDFTDVTTRYNIFSFARMIGREKEENEEIILDEDGYGTLTTSGRGKPFIRGEGLFVERVDIENVFDESSVRWTNSNMLGRNLYLFQATGSETYVIEEKDDDLWIQWKISDERAEILSDIPQSLEVAKAEIDTKITNVDSKIANKDQFWHERPITDKQKNKLRNYPEVWKGYESLDDIDRGNASLLIGYINVVDAIKRKERYTGKCEVCGKFDENLYTFDLYGIRIDKICRDCAKLKKEESKENLKPLEELFK